MGPLAGDGRSEGATFSSDYACPSYGAERQELLLCMCDVRLRVFRVFILKLVSQSPVQFSVSLLPWRNWLRLKALSLSVSAFLDLPAASCPFYKWREHKPSLCKAWSCVVTPCQGGASFIHTSAQQLCLECLHVPGTMLGAARTTMTVAGDTRLFRQDPPACCHTVLFISLILTSQFKGPGLFLFQSWSLLV